MRIRLKDGKQKNLIFLFKTRHCFTWKEFANYLNISYSALKEWYLENCLLPLEIFEILNYKYDYEKYIIEIKNENWGQSIGGIISKGNTKKIYNPNKSENLAELVGIILGDGNINRYTKGKKIATYALRICGHVENDYDYLINFVSPLIEDLFDIKAFFYKSKTTKSSYVIASSKKLVEFLFDIGLMNGNKVTRQVGIPMWIMNNKKYSVSCLRGLIDTDGCIFSMSKKDPHLLRISFKNHSRNLLEDVRNILIKSGFHPSKIITKNTIYLSRKKDVEKYLNDIGFHNTKHTRRLYLLAPWCREIF